MRCFGAFAAILLCVLSSSDLAAQTREEKVRADKEKVEAEGFWIYNDLDQALTLARRTGKPILVNLRCIPCEECVKLDDDLVDRDPVIRPLLEQFVCVRVVSTNGLDLSLFQFDTDQSFAVFMLNAEGTIYGRFGTRSHQTQWVGDVSLTGMAKALSKGLALHAEYPANRDSLAGKSGPEPEFASPENYPSLAGKYTSALNFAGNVVASCIHCHQIGDAQRERYRSAGQPMPDTVLYPYPHPKSVGIVLDPREAALVRDVLPESAAETAGLKAGDSIMLLAGQPICSIADVQWVLHLTDPDGGKVPAIVQRNGESIELALSLPPGWRRAGDLSWRVSSWTLRRMATGGMVLKGLDEAPRRDLGLHDGEMGILVDYLGEYDEHAAAKNAGFRKGDVLVAIDGRQDLLTEEDVFRYGVTEKKPGEKAAVTLIREGQRMTLDLPMQD